ncbi:ENTH-domain-containing protein [Pseudovirgaria hyperparasitica]|uniref:ENTH-domain-containing protein n=1 Tax=Pseudovirgaria hyperparasitica TaxID=470096 RepID=A0A6A6VYX2_9PEZI|nr:ENTH-domain-containing protein [Pseudovirgaria hyperparasitica]KAF2755483.1 ENTH-domain-containing protein [Pseudovirgaria hyperparasitica]
MDFASLKDQVSNLSLYDIKAGVRKVQNAVMNFTEMEAKVREATNNEPWGASSTLMQEIANATFNYQLLNEIMPMIYKRFTEKAAEEWRQIYKAQQLLEFLIKNGSERVIDDARSHISLLKMLRQFHYIDQNGKDQGINVRNRAKELAELLSDVDRIRQERKKARATRNKYGGVEGGMGLGGGMSSSSRYGGYGSEDAGGYGGYSGGVYGDGGGFGGNTSGFQDTQARRDRFEEYDEGDDGAATTAGRSRTGAEASTAKEPKKPDPPKPKAPEVDLFSFDEPAAPSAPSGMQATPAGNGLADDDDEDFDDFQSAAPAPSQPPQVQAKQAFSIPAPSTTSTTSSATQFAAPQPRSGAQGASLNDMFSSISPAPGQTQRPTGYQASQPNYFTSVPVANNQPASGTSTPSLMSPGAQKPAASKSSAGADPFGSLLAGSNLKKAGTPSQKGMSIADMQKQKASAGIWGAPASSQQGGAASSNAKPTQQAGAFGDLLG